MLCMTPPYAGQWEQDVRLCFPRSQDVPAHSEDDAKQDSSVIRATPDSFHIHNELQQTSSHHRVPIFRVVRQRTINVLQNYLKFAFTGDLTNLYLFRQDLSVDAPYRRHFEVGGCILCLTHKTPN